MKLLKSIAAYFIIAAMIFTNLSVTAFSTQNSYEISLKDFSEDFKELIVKHDKSIGINTRKTTESEENFSEPFLTNRLVVKTYSNEPLSEDCGAIDKVEGYFNWHIMQYDDSQSALAAFNFYREQSYVDYIEYDDIIINNTEESEEGEAELQTTMFSSGESSGHLSWGSANTRSVEANKMISDSMIELPEIVVGVIDTGVELHDFFTKDPENPRILWEPDWEQEHYIDSRPDGGHGTHVAGIIVDNTPSNVKIRPLSTDLFAIPNDESELSFEYEYEDENKNRTIFIIALEILLMLELEVDVINISMGDSAISSEGAKKYSESINDAVNLAVFEKDVPVVVAAGNEYDEAGKYYPGNAENAITVAATDRSNHPILFSNKGTAVDLCAPGGSLFNSDGIYSTVLNNGYAKMSGTSMAAPFVTAAVATLKSLNPNLTVEQIRKRLTSTASKPSNWNKLYSKNFGAGIVNFSGMIEAERSEIPFFTESDESTLEISLKSSDINARIYYTTNGTSPNPVNGTLYRGSIDLSNKNIATIKAIAVADNKLYSLSSEYIVRYTKAMTLYYKHEKQLNVPHGKPVVKWTTDNSEVVSIYSGCMTSEKRGTATVTAKIDSIRSATYEITVKYNWWQWLIIIFLFGWAWY
ncbi:MAG: S8 family serine peptidase [Clostridiaceae bacterium]|jgi:hypothetical protein|nr:S8 family serine peptidase [Clostridiaceae bacterium]